jgi:hypothetical protein
MKARSQKTAEGTAVILLLVLLVIPSTCRGWGDGGHMMVATIAYENLNPTARTNVDGLLSTNGVPGSTNEFVQASHWADDVKRTPAYASTADEHFVAFPFSPDHTPLPSGLPKAVNLTNALNQYVQVLKTSNATLQARIEAAKFVIHLVGDLHQPLHCATRVTQEHPQGDLGGNEFPIKDPDQELHSLWDGGFHQFPRELPGFQPPPIASVYAAVASLKTNYNFGTERTNAAVGGIDFGAWAAESFNLAQTNAYVGIVENGTPSSTYLQNVEVARRRVIWAGFRLATLLNAIWPEPE